MNSTDNTQPPRTIFIDLTHTSRTALNTGIQRVVRKLGELLPAKAGDAGYRTELVVFRDGCFQAWEQQSGWACFDYRELRRNLSERLPLGFRTLLDLLCKMVPPLRRWLLPVKGKLGVYYLPVKTTSFFLRPLRMMTRNQRRAHMRPQDILLLPDGYWAASEVWPGVRQARQQHVKIVMVVYDLIILTHPEFFPPDAYLPFQSYFSNVLKNADIIATTSKTVESDIKKHGFDAATASASKRRIEHFQLGCDFNDAATPVRPLLANMLSSPKPTFLVVSTLEPRKNHTLVLDAFEKLWEDHDVQLLFVGRLGWMSARLVERIETLRSESKRLFWFDDLTDAEVVYCYENAAAVICPSLVEGFGLPIVEALGYQRLVLASDTPVHCEVGGDRCQYYARNDSNELARLVASQLEGELRPACETTYKPATWSDSVSELLNLLLSTTTVEHLSSTTAPEEP